MRGRNSLPHSEPIEISIYHALSPSHQSLSTTSEICSDRVEVLRFTTSSSLRWAATTMKMTSPAMQMDNPLPPPQPQPQASEWNRADDVAFQPRSSSYLVMNQHQTRRRPGATAALTKPSSPTRQRSITQDIGHAAAETYLMTHLAIKLLRYLGVGYLWILKVLILLFYAMLLLPGFLQVAYYYVFSSQVRRSIVYGYQPRNRLDLYLPIYSKGPKPVLIFVTGGAWIIGYKAWGALLGKQLAERDIIVACIDYRNFPQGTMSDMVADVSAGISFVCNSVAELGGDPNRIFLMGQSAGAHISSCALLEHAIKESKGENVSWSISQIKAYFGLSGGYNMPGLVDHFHRRGLYRSIFSSIMEGEKGLQRFSPEIRVQDPSIRDAVTMLPHMILFHGTADYSIPSDASEAFVDALKKAGAKVELILYPGKTHTDLFLHDPMRGGKEELFDFLVGFIHDGDKEALAKIEVAPLRPRLCPEFLLELAHRVSPF